MRTQIQRAMNCGTLPNPRSIRRSEAIIRSAIVAFSSSRTLFKKLGEGARTFHCHFEA